MSRTPLFRRTLPLLLAAAVMGAAAPVVSAASPEAVAGPADAGFYRMKLGAFTVVALSDGGFDLPTDKLLVEDRPGQVQKLLGQAGLPTAVPSSVNGYLVDTGSKRVLIDAGSGALLGPSLGKLLAHLRAAGYAPEQIDEVLLTHLHPDHVGGLVANGQAAFPKAIIRADRREAKFWLDKSNLGKVDASVQGAFDGAAASLKPYLDRGRFKPFAAGERIEPGISALNLDGHTPGHTEFRVESQGRTLLVWGDVVHVAAVQFADPKVTIHFDSAPREAEAHREQAFRDAAQKGYLVAAAHIAFPGIGHVKREGAGYAWQPVTTAAP
ncbi:MBL fold metallo-hydrolase [Frateuria defendens]|uniref:MBL fold metallo-hydrolase n=1 Tax=Frateuria defendens TaxID=2219559 RepID=UPI00066FF9E1|nr:MBL fold metallo-hydrolase [Frateuria defendens]